MNFGRKSWGKKTKKGSPRFKIIHEAKAIRYQHYCSLKKAAEKREEWVR